MPTTNDDLKSSTDGSGGYFALDKCSFFLRAWKCPGCGKPSPLMWSTYIDGTEHQLALICGECRIIFTRFNLAPWGGEFERADVEEEA